MLYLYFSYGTSPLPLSGYSDVRLNGTKGFKKDGNRIIATDLESGRGRGRPREGNRCLLPTSAYSDSQTGQWKVFSHETRRLRQIFFLTLRSLPIPAQHINFGRDLGSQKLRGHSSFRRPVGGGATVKP